MVEEHPPVVDLRPLPRTTQDTIFRHYPFRLRRAARRARPLKTTVPTVGRSPVASPHPPHARHGGTPREDQKKLLRLEECTLNSHVSGEIH